MYIYSQKFIVTEDKETACLRVMQKHACAKQCFCQAVTEHMLVVSEGLGVYWLEVMTDEENYTERSHVCIGIAGGGDKG